MEWGCESFSLRCSPDADADADVDVDCAYLHPTRPTLPPRLASPRLARPRSASRPGILVLINDADWELEGELEYELQDGDEVCFISTLHGG